MFVPKMDRPTLYQDRVRPPRKEILLSALVPDTDPRTQPEESDDVDDDDGEVEGLKRFVDIHGVNSQPKEPTCKPNRECTCSRNAGQHTEPYGAHEEKILKAVLNHDVSYGEPDAPGQHHPEKERETGTEDFDCLKPDTALSQNLEPYEQEDAGDSGQKLCVFLTPPGRLSDYP